MVAWAHAIYQYHVNGTDTVGRSVGRSVDARGPVDHASVGLAQARPNYVGSGTPPLLRILTKCRLKFDQLLYSEIFSMEKTFANWCWIRITHIDSWQLKVD